jgi:hypothetical protein
MESGIENGSFVEETIDSLKRSAVEIEKQWNLLKNGKINKEKFEEEYVHILSGWLSELKHEEVYPNNNCKYSDTNHECDYFVKMGI